LQIASIGFFFVALCEIGLPRGLTLAVPAVYGLLPHHSTDRFWFLASVANLSMALCFLSLFADLRASSASGFRTWIWKTLSLVCLLASALAYEAPMPLFILSAVLVGLRAWWPRHPSVRQARMRVKATMLAGSTLVLLVSIAVFKADMSTRLSEQNSLLSKVILTASIAKQATMMSFIDEGLGLVPTALSIFRNYWDGTILTVSGLVGIGVVIALTMSHSG
jgi:hypothetical protein